MSENEKLNLPENGRILIDKPENMTSFGVVARVRRVLSKEFGKKVKVGHTGTLDPFATGLLVLVYGKETKNAMSLMKLDKVYEAEIALGETSSTGDPAKRVRAVTWPPRGVYLMALSTRFLTISRSSTGLPSMI